MVYIEYYVIENLVINYIIISCTSILIKRYNPKKNKLLGASLGGAYSVAYLYPSMNILFTVPFLEMEVEVFFQEEGMKKLYFGMIYLK